MVAHTRSEYFDEVRFPDLVTCGLRAEKIGNSSVTYEISLFRDDSEMSFADGVFVHVYVNRATRKPVPLSDEMRAHVSNIATTTD